VLAVGAPPPRRPQLPGGLRALTCGVLLVLGAGVTAAVQQVTAPPPPPAPPPGPVPGVTATARVDRPGVPLTRLSLEVVVAGGATGRGDTGGSSTPEQLRLLAVMADGFVVRLVGSGPPLVLGELGRFGSGLQYVVPLGIELAVGACPFEVTGATSLSLSLQRGDGPLGRVPVELAPDVLPALDRLVRRTCER
jgi:hypothetical protein